MGQYTVFTLDRNDMERYKQVCAIAVNVLDEHDCPEYILQSDATKLLRDGANRARGFDEFFSIRGRYDFAQDIIDFFDLRWVGDNDNDTVLVLDSPEMTAFANLGKAVIEEKHHLFKDIWFSAYCGDGDMMSDMMAYHYLNGITEIESSEDKENEIRRPEVARIRRNEFIDVLGSNVTWDSGILSALCKGLVTSDCPYIYLELAVVLYAVKEACKQCGIHYIVGFVC